MNIITEELFKPLPFPVMYVVTTNAYIKATGELVMGRGAALTLKTKLPTIPKECGVRISALGPYPVPYGFLAIRSPFRDGKAGIGIFQVKNNYSDPAEVNIIVKSCMVLKEWLTANPTVQVRMNYPGIGNGKLTRDKVEKVLLSFLADHDNLTICLR
jgi:hypothetical protein